MPMRWPRPQGTACRARARRAGAGCRSCGASARAAPGSRPTRAERGAAAGRRRSGGRARRAPGRAAPGRPGSSGGPPDPIPGAGPGRLAAAAQHRRAPPAEPPAALADPPPPRPGRPATSRKPDHALRAARRASSGSRPVEDRTVDSGQGAHARPSAPTRGQHGSSSRTATTSATTGPTSVSTSTELPIGRCRPTTSRFSPSTRRPAT